VGVRYSRYYEWAHKMQSEPYGVGTAGRLPL